MKKTRRSRLWIGFAVFGGVFALAPIQYMARGFLSEADCLWGLVTIATFVALAYLIVDAYLMTRDRVLMGLFIALFFWPLVSTGISFLLLGQIPSGNLPVRFRMGGLGDPVSVLGLVDVVVAGAAIARASLVLMLLTNISFLIPVNMIHARILKSREIIANPEGQPANQ